MRTPAIYLDARGRPTAERPPGYPAFLAAVFALSSSTRAVACAQALLGAASVGLVYLLLVRRSRSAAALAALFLAIDPIALGLVPFVLREALLQVLLIALLVVLDRTNERPWVQGLGAGVLLAALTLTHQLYGFLGPFLFLGALVSRRRIAPLLLAGAIVFLAIVGWTARNLSIGSKQLVLSSYPIPAGELWLMSESTNEWLHDDPTTGYQDLHFQEIARLQREHPGDIAAVKSELYARAFANLRREPLVVAFRVARINFWYWVEVPGSIRITLHPRLWVARLVLIPFHWLRLFWAVVALVELSRAREVRRTYPFEAATWLFAALAPAILLPLPRYLAPVGPLLDGFAALGIVAYAMRRQGALTAIRGTPTQVDGPPDRST